MPGNSADLAVLDQLWVALRTEISKKSITLHQPITQTDQPKFDKRKGISAPPKTNG